MVAVAAAPLVLTLGDPVGTQVELQTTTSQTGSSNLQVTVLSGSAASADQLAAIKRRLLAGMAGGH